MSEQDKTTMSAEEVLQKFDKESDKRNLTGMWDKLISFICIAFAVFQCTPQLSVYLMHTYREQSIWHLDFL